MEGTFPNDDETVSGAELLRRALIDEGTSVVFGHPGGAILPFYDALHRGRAPRHVLMRHEQSAAHAADGWARASGQVGVCCATSGPGATNLVTGLATAQMDGVPIVAVTGQVPRPLMGTDAFQETDIVGVTMPVTKHGFLVERAADVPDIVREAFRLARAGRPGPVLVDVPKDVQVARVPAPSGKGHHARGRHEASAAPGRHGGSQVGGAQARVHAAQAAALTELGQARRPVVLVGRGVVGSGTAALVRGLAENTGIPVVTTLLGLDGFPADHALALGMPGMHGTERANRALQRSDLILGLGVRFDDRVTGSVAGFAPGARIVHFDIDPRAIGRTVDPHVAVLGDLRATLPPFVREAIRTYRAPDAWWNTIRSWRRQADDSEPSPTAPHGADPSPFPLGGRQAVRVLARAIRRTGGIAVTDVGQHQMWLAQEFVAAECGTHLTSGGLGTMGFALGASIGAALARADRPVWAVVGDGGFQMTMAELATIAQERVPVRIAVVDNGHLGMVRQWQDRVHGGRHSSSRLPGPDFVRLARAFGLRARTLADPDTLARGLEYAAERAEPCLLHIPIANDEDVYPMVRPGGTLDEMWFEPACAEAVR